MQQKLKRRKNVTLSSLFPFFGLRITREKRRRKENMPQATTKEINLALTSTFLIAILLHLLFTQADILSALAVLSPLVLPISSFLAPVCPPSSLVTLTRNLVVNVICIKGVLGVMGETGMSPLFNTGVSVGAPVLAAWLRGNVWGAVGR